MLLFLCKHARLDIQMAIVFLRTRVKAPDQDDSKNYSMWWDILEPPKNSHSHFFLFTSTKLVGWRLFCYTSWHEVSYRWSHVIREWHSIWHIKATKNYCIQLNWSRACWPEWCVITNHMDQILLEAQGYQSKSTPIYQENMSTLILEKNGRI